MKAKRGTQECESGPKRGRAHAVDMRSDTVTKPTEKMREAMCVAEVGDDVFGDDPTIIKLQETAAKIFNKEAALYVPSGTMGNLISTMVHCELRGSEMLVGDQSHIVLYEQGGSATLAGVHTRQIPTQTDGTLAIADLEAALRVCNDHYPVSRLVCIESTHNKKGGTVLPLEYVDRVGEFAKQHGIKCHMDGARIMNAVVALGIEPARYVQACDSVSVCLSKGLGAPVGTVIVGTKDFIFKARRCRKALGGGMRQAGILAAAGLIALTEMPALLKLDHENAMALYNGIQKIEGISVAAPPQTNMIYATISVEGKTAQDFVDVILKHGVMICAIDKFTVRFAFHHQVSADDTQYALAAISETIDTLKSS